ncbi:lipopolysaccharide biosynthesis protein [Aestuariivirga sp.]|uniref:lipopolysaccharide biosynthesis protein n=1 Tax=Aestuariivirga sp. TaxID=2650926 RepID=UPI00359401A9
MPAVDKLKKLATGSAAIMASRLAGAGVGFLTQFLMVKLMGAHDLGVFYAASSLAAVLGVIVAQGYPQIAARFVGRYRNKQDQALTGYFTGHAMREGLLAAIAAAAGLTIWSLAWPGIDAVDRMAYAIAGWMLVSIVALNIMTNIAGGMRSFALCYMPEGLVRPIIFFIVICAAGIGGFGLTAVSAMAIFALITTGIACAVSVLLRRKMPVMRWRAASQAGVAWRWRREAWQLVLMAVFTNFFADVGILVAVPFLSKPELAIFGLCLKLALLVGYFVQIGQQMVVPDMADARHSGDTDRLQSAAWRSIVVPSLISLISIAVIYVFGAELLAFFGPEFAAGRTTLLILLTAQLFRALAGPGVHLLTLSGIQRINMGVAVTSLGVLFAASALLTPWLGIEGAAIAVLIVYAYWTGVSALALRHLKEPAVDIVWLTLRRFRAAEPSTQI